MERQAKMSADANKAQQKVEVVNNRNKKRRIKIGFVDRRCANKTSFGHCLFHCGECGC